MRSSYVGEKEIGNGNLVPVEIAPVSSDLQLVVTEDLPIIDVVNVVDRPNDIGCVDDLFHNITGPNVEATRYVGRESVFSEQPFGEIVLAQWMANRNSSIN